MTPPQLIALSSLHSPPYCLKIGLRSSVERLSLRKCVKHRYLHPLQITMHGVVNFASSSSLLPSSVRSFRFDVHIFLHHRVEREQKPKTPKNAKYHQSLNSYLRLRRRRRRRHHLRPSTQQILAQRGRAKVVLP